jgi:Fe2+ or Zn2+ uptake regulation protein
MNEARNPDRLSSSGLRFTPQRRHVYHILLQSRDHPAANEVFMRAKKGMPEISMATVYNCLEALVRRGLVRQVNVDRTATRYCPNLEQHCHFYCETCGGIFDVDYDAAGIQSRVTLPEEFSMSQLEVAVRGLCAGCAARKSGRGRKRAEASAP